MTNTVYALSSGTLPSGVAIIRISGPESKFVVETMCTGYKFGKRFGLSEIVDPKSGEVIDRGLVLTFVAPSSFTGEDVVEFHVHGSRAVVDRILEALSGIDGLCHAQAGEFTYRAFINGKLDLTQAEGIIDLVESETEAQRKLAFENIDGRAKRVVEKWADCLIKARAFVEAEIDFVEERDIPEGISEDIWQDIDRIILELDTYLSSIGTGEIIREGFRVTLLGKPNSGKSTLLNCLANRDVAIVTDKPGTTRDVLEVQLNLGGQMVIVSDTAGIRETNDPIEKEGIKRALKVAECSHMTIWLHEIDDLSGISSYGKNADLIVLSKGDRKRESGDMKNSFQSEQYDFYVSALYGYGVDRLVAEIGRIAGQSLKEGKPVLFSRERQRTELLLARSRLIASKKTSYPLEVRAENLRVASDALGRITGRVDVEDILEKVFSRFCVGK